MILKGWVGVQQLTLGRLSGWVTEVYRFVQTALESRVLVVKGRHLEWKSGFRRHSICGELSILVEYLYLVCSVIANY